MNTRPLSALVPLLIVLTTGTAQADIMPPGMKGVDYTVTVANLEAHPDYVFLLYPYGTSNGAPDPAGFELMTAAPKGLGRWHESTLYAMPKADFDAAKLSALSEADLKAHFASDRVMASTITVADVRVIEEDSPVSAIQDVIRIDKIEGKTLVARFDKVVYTTTDGATKEIAWTGGGRPGIDSKPAEPASAPKAASKSGCAAGGGALVSLLGLALVLRRRRA